ncbi:MAG: two-component regulator propeller domain-containing protein [Bacteroidales bacterium]|nr:two-component regulator propeller domain-containing protein [Bacteroidales bacterium]
MKLISRSGLKELRKGILLCLFLYLSVASFSQKSGNTSEPEKLNFKHLSIEDGLSGNIINKIIEDSYGFIWIATPNGLNKYNGIKVTVYYHNPSDTGSIPNNEIADMAVDQSGNFWIGTKKGLCRFNYATEKFERHLQKGSPELNSIASLYVDNKNKLWVGTQHGLYQFDRTGNDFIKVIADNEINLYAPLCFAEYPDGTVLVGTWEKGFYRINENHQYHKRETISISGINNSFGLNTINSVLIDRNNTAWFATREGVVKGIQSVKGIESNYSYSLFQKDLSAGKKNIDPSALTLCEDKEGSIWIGTENGLYIYNPLSQKIRQFKNDPSAPYSLSNNHIKCIFKDRNGNIWLGTYQGGINVFHPNQDRFKNYFQAINNASDQKMRYVKSIFQDGNRTIWIGTDLGLLKFSENGQLLQSFVSNLSDPYSINKGGVSAILEDRKGRLWVGTWGGGLHELNRETGKFTRLPYIDRVLNNPKYQADNTIRSIAEDSKGNIWIGTIRGYLDKYDPETKTFEHFIISLNESELKAMIQDVRVDKNDNVWVGTLGGGLIRLDSKTRKMKRFMSLSNTDIPSDSTLNGSDVYSMFFLNENQLWLGTGNGVQVLNLGTNRIKSYTINEGLPSNIVYSILHDNVGNIWLSTLKGISRFNPVSKVFTNYDSRDGIRINSECGYKSSTGWLFFGGVNGINAINPSELKENFVIPPIVFTDFKISNKSVEIGENSILEKNIDLTTEIEIPYDQNIFSIEFAALNYVNSEKNQYACKLEGFDKDWVKLGSENEARYTNLSPGKYSFYVKASNNDGLWNEKSRVIKIIILPPWWKTWWFRLLAVIVLFLGILAWILFRTFRLREQQRRLKKLVFERTAEIEAQKLKLQQQADELQQTNQLLLEKQNEVFEQKEAIAAQNEKLGAKNELLEKQKNKISEQRQKEQELAEKLHEADQLKLRFFTNISHEFRTPLTLILGPINKLLSSFGTHHEFDELGKIIQRNTIRLLNLINQFLDLSRLEAGVVTLSISKGDVFTYISGIVNAYKYAASQKNIEYNYISDVDSHICFFDADKIEKILYNLLSNAFKFTPENGRIDVTVNLLAGNKGSQEPETIRITVSDTGKGIPAEYLSRIFERFYQVDTNSTYQTSGTGIGLALTHDLVTIYRGDINAESSPERGATFTVNLPIDKASFREQEFAQGQPVINDFKLQLIAIEDHAYDPIEGDNLEIADELLAEVVETDNRLTLLIVDDNPDIRKYLIDQFGDEFRIIEARDGKDGLEKALKHLPKLVITDVMMPRMNGYELCAQLKTDILTCHIPVIILTAKASSEDQLESIETGADAYIAKPFDIRLLETQIRQLIASREQLKQLFRRELTIGPTEIVVDSSDEKLMHRIIKVMSENVSNPDFGVEELGKEVGLSRTHLYRKLKQLTNHTAIEFVRDMRLQRAAQLFKQNKLYVAEVAYMSGFKELSYFRKIFREYYGMSPQEYINSCNK